MLSKSKNNEAKKVIIGCELLMNNYNPDNLTETQLWLLALGAFLAERNGDRHDTLYGCEPDDYHIADWKNVLRRDWGINDRQQLFQKLEWLIKEGHRGDFQRLNSSFALYSYQEQQRILRELPSDSPFYNLYQLVNLYGSKLSDAGIAAWDYGRYISLCRKGAMLKYITDDEAWELMKRIASDVQTAYPGWYEYGLGYIIGRIEWQNKLTEVNAHKHVKWLDNFLLKQDGPWVKIDWNTNLEL
jgi:hypothetical protein